jgi:hypothetical protein
MATFTRTITEEFLCTDCRYQSIEEEFLVEFNTDAGEPAFGFIHCPSCGGGDREVTVTPSLEEAN